MNYLHEGLVQLGFEKGDFCGIKTLPLPELEEKMDIYIKTLLEFNEKFDLINTEDYDETAIRHVLDSLSGAEKVAALCAGLVEKSGTELSFGCNNLMLADIGSGAGLPGIPLATAFPSLNFTLVERMSKRCNFLLTCAQKLNLENVTIEENRFDLCVFRAFRPLDKKMLKILRRILKDNGKLAAYKAKAEKIKEEMEALESSSPKYVIEKLTVPFLTENTKEGEERERNLVVIEK